MKRKRELILIFIFLLLASFAKSQDKDDLTLWFGVSWNPVSVSNLPLYLRDIPEYQDIWGTIDEPIYEMSYYVPFDFRFLISNNNFGINYGIGAEVAISSSGLFMKDRYKYGGTATFDGLIRTGPISFTGLKPILPGLSLNPNIFIDIPLGHQDITSSHCLHLSVGYQALTLVNGWETRFSDGNQKLKYNKMKVLAHLFPVNVGLQFKILKADLEAGPNFLLAFQTRAGKECAVNTNAIGLFFKLKMPEN